MSTPIQARLEALFDIAQLLASEEDLDALLDRILSEVHGVMDATAASLLLRVPGTDYLEFVGTRGKVAEKIQRMRLNIGQGISGEVARTRRAINVSNAYLDNRFNRSFDLASGFVTKQILAMPLEFRDEVVGVISIFNRIDDKDFDAEDERILRIFCDQASIAIINAKERRRNDQKNRALSIFANEIGSILGNELTLVYGYIHQMNRVASQKIKAKVLPEEYDNLLRPLEVLERSTDVMVRIARTMNVFTRSTQNSTTELFSCDQFLSDFLRDTRHHYVKVYSLGSRSVLLEGVKDSLFLIVEALLHNMHTQLKIEHIPGKPDVNVALISRARLDRVDFCICVGPEIPEEKLQLSLNSHDGHTALSQATIESVIDNLNAELLDRTALENSGIQNIELKGVQPPCQDQSLLYMQAVWQICISSFSDAEP